MKTLLCSLLLTLYVGGTVQAQDSTKTMSHKAHKMGKDAKKGMDKAEKKMKKDEKKMN